MSDSCSEHPLYTRGLELFDKEEFAAAATALSMAATATAADPAVAVDCLYWATLAHANADDLHRALDAMLAAHQILDRYEPSEFSVECAELTAQILADLDRTEESVDYLRRAAFGYTRLGDTGHHAETQQLIGRALAEIGAGPLAVAAFEAAERGFHTVGRTREAAHTHTARADLAVESEDHRTARRHLERARELFDSEHDRDELARCWYLAGLMSHDLGDATAAEHEIGAALHLAEAVGDPEMVAECSDTLGDLLLDAGRFDEGLRCLRVAALGYPPERAEQRADCHRRIGMILIRQAKVDLALAAWEQACSEYLAAGRPDSAAELTVARGCALEDLTRYDEAVEQYSAARTAFEAIGSNSETAWCDVNLATVHIARGDHTTAEQLLIRSSAVLADTDRARYLASQCYLGVLHLNREQFADARQLLTRTHTEAVGLELAELTAECSMHLAAAIYYGGDAHRPLALLDEARRLFEELNEWPKVAICQSLRGLCQYSSGNFRAAEESLLDSRAGLARHGKLQQLAATDAHLGLVYSETNRLPEAETALDRARAIWRAVGTAAQVAVAEANLAGVYLRQARYPEAERLFESAESVLSKAGHTVYAAICRQNLGGARVMLGRIDTAIVALESALEIYGTDPTHRRNVAMCTLNIGLAHARRSEYRAAVNRIGQARQCFADADVPVEVAKCDLLTAACLVAESNASPRTALDLALPAAIYIDHQRLQFVHAHSRVAWTARYAAFQTELFDWAAQLDDPALMAELIDVTINSGVHVADIADSLARTDFLTTLATDIAAEPIVERTSGLDARQDPLTSATGILIAGAVLPMRPPPLLRAPGGAVALASFIDSAGRRYGPIERTLEVVAW